MVAKLAGMTGVVLALLAHRWFNRGPELIRLMDLIDGVSDEQELFEFMSMLAKREVMPIIRSMATLLLAIAVIRSSLFLAGSGSPK